MKFLADMGISMAIVRALREVGEDVIHLRDQGLQTWPDGQILEKAAREQRTILT
jgi:predicted nuclease of predicted toxin-antitoxin system